MTCRMPGIAAALRAGLADPLVLAGGLDDAAAFADVVADRLLDVHVLAGLHGPDRHQRVPVVRRGDADDIDALVVEHLRGCPRPTSAAASCRFSISLTRLLPIVAIDIDDVA